MPYVYPIKESKLPFKKKKKKLPLPSVKGTVPQQQIVIRENDTSRI